MNEWGAAFDARDDLKKYKSASIGLFALQLKFGIEDIHSVAADAITDGGDDKKCDIVYINSGDKYAVIAQCYLAETTHGEAKANKASDLHAALAWLISSDVKTLPVSIKGAAIELRDALTANAIERIYVLYIHNKNESANVERELVVVANTCRDLLEKNFGNSTAIVYVNEIGQKCFSELYQNTTSQISVTDTFEFALKGWFEATGHNWSAFVTSIQLSKLKSIYRKYKNNLFSANIRDYLGSINKDENINNNIKRSAAQTPDDFWVFNNGLTILTHNITVGSKKITIEGMSIVNGAQTTGAIANTKGKIDSSATVLVRFVKTVNQSLLGDIIKYNNSQNKVTATDYRSNDKIQKRLCTEMDSIRDAKYLGGRRGSTGDAIKRNPNLLPSYTVAQALLAFHKDPVVAYKQKSEIWYTDSYYQSIFNEKTTAKHIVFVYSLLKAIEDLKISYMNNQDLTESQIKCNSFLRLRGATHILVRIIAKSLETLLGQRVSDLFMLSFSDKISPSMAKGYWVTIIETFIPLAAQSVDTLANGINTDTAQQTVDKTQALFESVAAASKGTNNYFDTFKRKVVIG